MIDLGKYTAVVLSAYGATIVLLGGLVITTILSNRRARRALEAHENNG